MKKNLNLLLDKFKSLDSKKVHRGLFFLSFGLFVLVDLFIYWPSLTHYKNEITLLTEDATLYHQRAKDLASAINQEGFKALSFDFSPSHTGHTNLMALLYYLTGKKDAYILLICIFNALLLSITSLVLYRFTQANLKEDKKIWALVPPLLCLSSPSLFFWASQPLKTPYSFLGITVLGIGLIENIQKLSFKNFLKIILGALIFLFARPQHWNFILYFIATFFIFYFCLKQIKFLVTLSLLTSLSVFLFQFLLLKNNQIYSDQIQNIEYKRLVMPHSYFNTNKKRVFPILQTCARNKWHHNFFMPRFISSHIRIIADRYNDYLCSFPASRGALNGPSLIHRSSKLLELSIKSFWRQFAPLFSIKKASRFDFKAMLLYVEMIIFWTCLPGIINLFFNPNKAQRTYLALGLTLFAFMGIFALYSPNWGTLFRLRLPFMPLLYAIAVLGMTKKAPQFKQIMLRFQKMPFLGLVQKNDKDNKKIGPHN